MAKKKKSPAKKLGIIIFIIITLSLIITFFLYHKYSQPSLENFSKERTSDFDNAKLITLKTNDLSFKIPDDWYHDSRYANTNGSNSSTPYALGYISFDNIPPLVDFKHMSISAESKSNPEYKSLESFNNQLTKVRFGTDNVKSREIKINNNTFLVTEYMSNPWYEKEAVMEFNNKYYWFHLMTKDNYSLYSNYFDQILSTIKFIDSEGAFCGGFAGKACPEGYTCRLDGNYPDAGGKCIK